MKIRPDLIQSPLPITEEDARERYGPAKSNGYGKNNKEGLAMDSALTAAGHYSLFCHAADFIGNNVMPQFPGYGVLAGLSQNGLIRAGIEMIADEMTREWIELTRKGEIADRDNDGSDDTLTKITAEIERFDLIKLFRKATEMCGYYGGCLVYIDTGESAERLLNPLTLDAATFKPGSLKGFKIIEPFNIAPGLYNASEPWAAKYFKPDTWWILGRQVHASRFLYFTNNEVPTLLRPAYNFFGISTTQIVLDAVKHFTDCREAEARLLNKFSMTVFKTNMDVVLSGGGREELDRRIQFMVQHRNNDGVMAIHNGPPGEGGEDIIKLETPLSGVTDIVRQSMEIVSAYFNEPATKMWGISPAGFNATGQSDMTNHYDHIASRQEKIFRAPLLQALRLLQMNMSGAIDESIAFTFRPLGEDDGKIQAEVQKLKADTDAVLTSSGVLDPAEVRARLATDPDSGYNNIDVDIMPSSEEAFTPDDEMDMTVQDPSATRQEISMNGAQIASMVEIVMQVATGQIPRNSGLNILTTAFPISIQQAEKIMGDVGEGFTPAAPAEGSPNMPPMAQDEDTWITTKGGHRCLLGENGEVKAGMGGVHNGEKMGGGSGGTTAAEKQKKIDSVKIDFTKDNTLPGLNKEDLAELGKEDKPVLLKKDVIGRNLKQHPEVKTEDYNRLVGQALYNSDDRFGGKEHHNPDYVNFVKYGETKGALTLIELADRKDNYEIVHVFEPKKKNIERMKPK